MTENLFGAVAAAISAVLGAVGGLLSGVWIERRRTRWDSKVGHAREVRAAVLDPLVQRISSYSLAICDGRLAPIELVGVRNVGPFGDMADRDHEYVDKFVPLRPIGDPHISFDRQVIPNMRDASHGRVDPVMLEHAKHHLPDPIARWETTERNLSAWQAEVIDHAGRIFQTLTAQSGLPVVRALSGSHGVFKNLGLWVVERQLGVTGVSLYLNRRAQPGMFEASIFDGFNRYFAFGSPAEMESCMATVRQLVDDPSARDALVARRSTLMTAFRQIHEQVRLAASKSTLPGQCSVA